jgi:hypothetical protein
MLWISNRTWPWSYGSWIYNYLCNQYISPLMLWVRIPLRRAVLDTTLYDKICQWLVAGRWLSPVSSTNKTDSHDNWNIVESGVKHTAMCVFRHRSFYFCCCRRMDSAMHMYTTVSPGHLRRRYSWTFSLGFMVFNATFNNISVIVAVSFIGGGNRRQPPTCHKSLTNFII